mmetsp:Transcript_13849/g.43857  ORF Transcript_13849/g.43857 Transcript_13849/m.43857 type:complete len:202 (-) Transcript_13849:1460-2065(-)
MSMSSPRTSTHLPIEWNTLSACARSPTLSSSTASSRKGNSCTAPGMTLKRRKYSRVATSWAFRITIAHVRFTSLTPWALMEPLQSTVGGPPPDLGGTGGARESASIALLRCLGVAGSGDLRELAFFMAGGGEALASSATPRTGRAGPVPIPALMPADTLSYSLVHACLTSGVHSDPRASSMVHSSAVPIAVKWLSSTWRAA